MNQPLVFVSGSKGKIEEAKVILNRPLEVIELDLDEMQDLSIEKIVRRKAADAYQKVKKPVFVDDVSLEVAIWNGFPGPFIKYLREAGGNELLLRMLEQEKDTSVTLKASIGFHDGVNIHVFVGKVQGKLVKPRGERGWGFDPIFQPDGETRTFAEMSEEEKNALSHRRRALEKFKEYLDTNKLQKGS